MISEVTEDLPCSESIFFMANPTPTDRSQLSLAETINLLMDERCNNVDELIIQIANIFGLFTVIGGTYHTSTLQFSTYFMVDMKANICSSRTVFHDLLCIHPSNYPPLEDFL
jgi:hypothetical protein